MLVAGDDCDANDESDSDSSGSPSNFAEAASKPSKPTLVDSTNQGRCPLPPSTPGFSTYTVWSHDVQRCFQQYIPYTLATHNARVTAPSLLEISVYCCDRAVNPNSAEVQDTDLYG